MEALNEVAFTEWGASREASNVAEFVAQCFDCGFELRKHFYYLLDLASINHDFFQSVRLFNSSTISINL